MNTNSLFSRTLRQGDALKPYMVAGCLEKDYIGNIASHQKIADDFLLEAISDMADLCPKELDTFTVSGIEGKWKIFSENAPRYAAGKYHVYERLSLLPVYTELWSPVDQTVELEFSVNRCAVILNGELVLNNDYIHSKKWPRVYVFEHVYHINVEKVTLNLKAGMNRLLYLGVSYNRSTGQTFSAAVTSLNEPITATVPTLIDLSVREQVHNAMQHTYLVNDMLKVGETPILKVGELDASIAHAELEFKDERISLDNLKSYEFSKHLPIAAHPFKVNWYLNDGTPITEKNYSFGIYNTYAPMPGYDRYNERIEKTLTHLSNKGDPLALYRLERADEISIERIEKLCDSIEKRRDCADFYLLPLLWLAHEDRFAKKLDPQIHELIKHAALSFRYWVDEPGGSSMFYCSENHRIGFHVCEYLAGLLYPADVFVNCNQNGVFHSLKGRMHLVEWLSQRCKMGFDEPHSANYLPVTFSALLCLREVLPREEYPLRNMVNVLLDFMTFIFATSNFYGIMATPRARDYNSPLRSSLASGSTAIFWMLFGNCEASSGALSAELAFSYYVPPKFICDIAEDYSPATYYFKEGLMHFDKHNADFTIRRTPDYMLGGVRDHNVGACDMHFIPAMVALKGDVSIFFSAPNNCAEGNGLRPDYWAGEAFMPRVLTYERTLAVIWHGVNDPKIWMTHVHFNTPKLDEYRSVNGYTFGKKDDGYVAIYSSADHKLSFEGPYGERELISQGRECVWITFCGSRSEDGSFDNFIEKIISNPITIKNDEVSLLTPDGEKMEFGLEEGFKINGIDVEIPDYLCLCPYLKSKFGSGKFEYRYNGETLTQWTYPASV